MKHYIWTKLKSKRSGKKLKRKGSVRTLAHLASLTKYTNEGSKLNHTGKSKVPNHYAIQIFLEQCLNGATQRTMEINLNGVTVNLLENRIPEILQKLKHFIHKTGTWKEWIFPQRLWFFNTNASTWKIILFFSSQPYFVLSSKIWS